MTFDRYRRVIEAVLAHPWAILPEKAAAIVELLRLRAAGLTLTDQEIAARIGHGRDRPAEQREGAIAVLPVFGTISHRINLMTEISGGTSTEQLTADIRQLAADPAVGTIVLDVDSPGGSVFGIRELVDEIRAVKKPVIAVANALMASGAYWIASAADEIVVTPSGQVGSIGVFTMHEDWSKAIESEGVSVSIISAGKYKTEGNPFEPLTDEARAAIQAEVDHYYAMFTKDVAKGRGVEVDAVRSGFGEGRVVNAPSALKAGMVDRIATLDEVVGDLVKSSSTPARARATGDRTVAIVKNHNMTDAAITIGGTRVEPTVVADNLQGVDDESDDHVGDSIAAARAELVAAAEALDELEVLEQRRQELVAAAPAIDEPLELYERRLRLRSLELG